MARCAVLSYIDCDLMRILERALLTHCVMNPAMKRTTKYAHQPFLPLVVLLAAVLAACGAAPAQSVPVEPSPPPVIVQPAASVQYEVEVQYEDEDYEYVDYEDEDYEDTDPSAVVIFRTQLEPHGVWVEDLNYGVVWVPNVSVVGPNFVPYSTAGYWAYTDSGDYVWVSDYSWGEVVFHYGRWVWISGVGWAWIPGRKYAPAWVVWRVPQPGYYYVGWAPMPPTFYWYGGVAVSLWVVPPPRYVYCESRYVFVRHEHHHRLSGPHAEQAERHTRPYTPAKPASSRTAARPTANPSPEEAGVPQSAIPKQRISSRNLMRQRANAIQPQNQPQLSEQVKDTAISRRRPQIDLPVRTSVGSDTAGSDAARSDKAGQPRVSASRFADSGTRELAQEHRVAPIATPRSTTDSSTTDKPALRDPGRRDTQLRSSAMQSSRADLPRNSTVTPNRPDASRARDLRTRPQNTPSRNQVIRPDSSSQRNREKQEPQWNRPDPRPAPSARRDDSQLLNRPAYQPQPPQKTQQSQKADRPLPSQSKRSTTSSTSSETPQWQSTRNSWQSAPASRSQFQTPSFQQQRMGTARPPATSWQNNNQPSGVRNVKPSQGGHTMPSRPSSSRPSSSSPSGRSRR